MIHKLGKQGQKIQKKGGERKMKRVNRILIVLFLATVMVSFCMPQEASAGIVESLKNVWKTITTVVSYAYDGLGRLIGQTQTSTATGVDLEGNNFEIKSTTTYDIVLGKAVVASRITEDYRSHENGSWERRITTVTYSHDANGCLTGAQGTETIEGQDADYYTDKSQFEAMGGNPDDILKDVGEYDLDGDGKIEDGEKNAVKVKGNTYSGTAKLEYILIDGEAYVSHREGTIVYRSATSGQEQFTRTISTDYKYDIKGGQVVLTDTYTTQTDTYPQTYSWTDSSGKVQQTDQHLFRSQYIHTQFEYDANGNLTGASGTGCGWGLINDPDIGFAVYTSDITVTYQIINGQARVKEYKEVTHLEPAQNPPHDVVYSDPEGTVIGKFDIISSQNNVGQQNFYTYLVIKDKDGKVWLARVLTKSTDPSNTRPKINVSGINIGDRVRFAGDKSASGANKDYNRIYVITTSIEKL